MGTGLGHRSPFLVALIAAGFALAAGAAPAIRLSPKPKCLIGAAGAQQLAGCLPPFSRVKRELGHFADPRVAERHEIDALIALRSRVRARGKLRLVLSAANRVLRRVAGEVVNRDGRSPPRGVGRARAVLAAAEPISQKFDDGQGGTVTGSGGLLQPGPGQVGDGFNINLDWGRTVRGVQLGSGFSVGYSGFADRCPDAHGEINGRSEAHAGGSLDANGVGPNGSVAVNLSGGAQGRGTFKAHVGADGKISHYDIEIDVVVTYNGIRPGLFLGIGRRKANERYELHMSLMHLHLGQYPSPSEWQTGLRTATVKTSGFARFGLGAGRLSAADVKDYSDAAGHALALSVAFADQALEKSQKNFYDDAACLRAKFEPGSLSGVAPGSTNPVGVTVSSVRDGQPVSMPVTLKAAPGGVTPKRAQSGASPIQANLTVSQKPNDTTTMSVDGTSSRGRLTGEMTASTAGPLTVVYTPSSTANASYSYDQSVPPYLVEKGTYSEQRSLGMTATVPVTSPGPGQSAVGSGALTWQSSSWTTDDVNTSTAQGLAQTCTIDFKTTYSAFTPGVLQVKSLRVGTPGPGGAPNIQLDVIVNGVGEHSHLVETNQGGPCPTFNNDSDTNHFESELNQMHSYLGDPVQQVGKGFEVRINTGWQPGTGNVVAKRTLSWFHEAARPGGPADAIRVADTFKLIRSG
jgi:hypothetical protein